MVSLFVSLRYSLSFPSVSPPERRLSSFIMLSAAKYASLTLSFIVTARL